MSTFKKKQVVMLSTNEKANITIVGSELTWSVIGKVRENNEGYHLYILSDEEIKEGDWVYNEVSKVVYHFKENHVNYEKKIIATTDKSLAIQWRDSKNDLHIYHLPQPSTQFIEKFVEEYNKGNLITEVMVEYFDDIYFREERQAKGKLKINPKDNTITIRKCKESWIKEEHISDIKKCCMYIVGKYTRDLTYDLAEEQMNKWIEENL